MKEAPKHKKIKLFGNTLTASDEVIAKLVKQTERQQKKRAKLLFSIFMDAVNRHDRKRIMEIAEAVWFFKDKIPPLYSARDSIRRKLLFFKQTLDYSGEKLTTAQVADWLDIEYYKTPNGHRRLQTIFNEINFPWIRTNKTTRKP